MKRASFRGGRPLVLGEKRKEVVEVSRDYSSASSEVEKREGFMEGEGVYEWII